MKSEDIVTVTYYFWHDQNTRHKYYLNFWSAYHQSFALLHTILQKLKCKCLHMLKYLVDARWFCLAGKLNFQIIKTRCEGHTACSMKVHNFLHYVFVTVLNIPTTCSTYVVSAFHFVVLLINETFLPKN